MQAAPASVIVVRVEDAEMDDLWRFVQSQKRQSLLWHAISNRSGNVLAYALAAHADSASAPPQRIVSSVFSRSFLHGWLGGVLAVARRANSHCR